MRSELLLLKKSLFRRKIRTFLTIFSIVLGITTIVALQIAIETTKNTLSDSHNSQISNSDITIRTSTNEPMVFDLEKLKSSSEVEALYPRLYAYGITKIEEVKCWTKLIGCELQKEKAIGNLKLTKGELPKSGEILITKDVADLYAYNLGDSFEVQTDKGDAHYKISGILSSSAMAQGGHTAVLDLTELQNFYYKDGISLVNVTLKKGVEPQEAKDKLTKVLGDIYSVDILSKDLGGIKGLFFGLNMFGVMALFVGAFLIYNTMSAVAVNAGRDIAIMKVMGYTRRNIMRWILLQASIYGVLGSMLGLAAGIGVSRLMTAMLLKMAIGQSMVTVTIPWLKIIMFSALGVIISLLSSLLPALKAAGVSVVEGLSIHRFRASFSEKKTSIILVVVAVVTICILFLRSIVPFASAAVFIGTLLCSYFILLLLIKPLSALLGGLWKRISPLYSYLVGMNMKGNVVRTGNTIFALTICIAMSTAFLGVEKGMKDSISKFVKLEYQGDITLTSWLGVDRDTYSKISDIPGVKKLSQGFIRRNVSLPGWDLKVTLRAFGQEEAGLLKDLNYKGTDSLKNDFASQDGIIISKILKEKLGIEKGDSIKLPVKDGIRTVKVKGIVDSYQMYEEVIYLSSESFIKYYPEANADTVVIYVDNEKNNNNISKGILKLFSSSNDIVEARATKEAIKSMLNDSVDVLFLVLIGIAFITAALTVINSMVMNVYERSYQISLLKSMGVVKKQMLNFMLLQGTIFALVSMVFGVALGIFLQYGLILLTQWLMGWSMTFTVNYGAITIVCGVGLVIAALSSFFPGVYSYRIKVTDVLRTGEL